MAILPIRIVPDPVLRARCAEVEQFDAALRRLAADMVETMHAAPGVGLAAPQVGEPRRLMMVDLSVGEDPEQLRVFVNPRIAAREGSVAETEGCLSIPGVSDKVVRPQRVRVEAQDLDGNPFALDAEDWLARAICHEVDHLDGVLFIDHLHGLRRERARRQLRRLVRETEPAEVPA
jgi:peptide deformylase